MMRWSFDDLDIGLIRSDGKALATREIRRPLGLVDSVWHEHAKQVCAVLNKDSSRAVS